MEEEPSKPTKPKLSLRRSGTKGSLKKTVDTKPSKPRKLTHSSRNNESELTKVIKDLAKSVQECCESHVSNNKKFREAMQTWHLGQQQHLELVESYNAAYETVRTHMPNLISLLPSYHTLPNQTQFHLCENENNKLLDDGGEKENEAEEEPKTRNSNTPIAKLDIAMELIVIEKKFYQQFKLFQGKVGVANDARKREFLEELKMTYDAYESTLKRFKDAMTYQLKHRSTHLSELHKTILKSKFNSWINIAKERLMEMRATIDKCQQLWFKESTTTSNCEVPIPSTSKLEESSSEDYDNIEIPQFLGGLNQMQSESSLLPFDPSQEERTISLPSDNGIRENKDYQIEQNVKETSEIQQNGIPLEDQESWPGENMHVMDDIISPINSPTQARRRKLEASKSSAEHAPDKESWPGDNIPVLDDLISPINMPTKMRSRKLEASKSAAEYAPDKENQPSKSVSTFCNPSSPLHTPTKRKKVEISKSPDEDLPHNEVLRDNSIVNSLFAEMGNTLSCDSPDHNYMYETHFMNGTLERQPEAMCLQNLEEDNLGPGTEMSASASVPKPVRSMVTCEVCYRLFDDISEMSAHFSLMHTAKMCLLCGKACNGIDDLIRHVKKHHSDYRVCPTCGQINDMLTFADHQASHSHSAPSSQCHVCSSTFETREKLNEHHRLAHKELFYICEEYFCNTMCTSMFEFNQHALQHKKPEFTTHVCKICSYYFQTEDALNKHLKNTHLLLSNSCPADITCILCYREFNSKESLVEHIETYHSLNIKVLQANSDDGTKRTKDMCYVCDRSFKNPVVKAVHMLVHHTTEPYTCPCGKRFCVKGALDFHQLNHTKLEQVQLNMKPYGTRGRKSKTKRATI